MTAWAAPGHEESVDALAARLVAAEFPRPPEGFTHVTLPRLMRVVLTGPLPGSGVPVVVKWHRPVTWLDRLARRFLGGRGPREARVLRALRERGLLVPEPLGANDEGVDYLVTRRIENLRPLPHADAAPRRLVEEVARLLARVHAAGVVHRDLTAGNLALSPEGPVLVDLGGARLAETSSRRRTLAHLAQIAHGLLHGASRSVRARGLRTWLVESGRPPESWRAWAPVVERALGRRVRRHHRRRERRPRRPGRHFAQFGRNGAVGVRRTPDTPERWEHDAAAWLTATPPGARALKGEGVVRVHLPGREQACVVKRYAGVARGRLPRPVRAFQYAMSLQERGLEVATPLLAWAGAHGAGVLVSAFVDAPDLLALTTGGAASGFGRWPPARQRACLVALGRSLRRLHDAEVSHRDLKPSNLLVVAETGGGFRFPLVDLEGVRPRYGPVSWRRRARDLARLAASLPLSRADRLRILTAYHRVSPAPPWPLRRLAHVVHTRADAHRRRLRARYGAPNPRPPA